MNRTRIVFLGGMGLGAALMYTLDPEKGRQRRARVRDRLKSLGPVAGLTGSHAPSDRVLADRVCAAIGRAVSHPGSIAVEVQDGCAVLTGRVLERETRELLRRVGRVAGGVKVLVCMSHGQLDLDHAGSRGRQHLAQLGLRPNGAEDACAGADDGRRLSAQRIGRERA